MPRARIVFVTAWLACSVAGEPLRSQRASPPFSPVQALETFRIAEGVDIQLFAAEPLIASPVAMEIDDRGQLFVVEMPGYPVDLSGSGRIRLLKDTDGNGLPDASTIFADGLRLPTGVMKWKNGILVTDSPQLWYFEDANGDGRAEIKHEILTGFALSNPQHTTNAPLYGLDNWIYLANEGPVRTIRYRDIFGDAGGEVRFSGRPTGPRLPPDADGRNVRFRPDSFELETLSSRSQFGQTFDAWGHHFLLTHNRHIIHEVIAARYLSRNPSLLVPSAVEHVPDYPLPATLFPITHQPEFQLLTDVGVMTSASGITYYLGDLLPPEYRNAVFVAEGAHNLVHVAQLRDHGATFRARRMFDGREFLASTDAWFRPVNMYVGPDGALYLIDYYRKVLEHPEWMDEAVVKSADLTAGRDRGRIYRIVPRGAPPPTWLGRVGLGDSSTKQLVETLSHPNIWWRRHAQRLLLDRRPHGAADLMALTRSSIPHARLHGLWTLEGLGELTSSAIASALHDPIAGVRENAIKLAELHLGRDPSLVTELLRRVDDADPKVRFQLVLTLGNIGTAEVAKTRLELLFDNVDDEWMQIASLSGRFTDYAALIREAVARLGGTESAGARSLFNRLGAIAATQHRDIVRAVMRMVLMQADSSAVWWQAAALTGLAAGIPPEHRRSGDWDEERGMTAAALNGNPSTAVRRALLTLLEVIGLPPDAAGERLVLSAELVARDAGADADARADAVRLLALRSSVQYEPLLFTLLGRAEPTPVHLAAVRALGDIKSDRIVSRFMPLWERWTPAVRDEVLRVVARDPARIRILLDAVAAGRVKVSEIEWPLRVRMMMSDDDALRTRARTLFGRAAADTQQALVRYRQSTTMSGSVARGRQVFERTCAACHTYRNGVGIAFGPDLGEVRGRLPGALLIDIIRPNDSIADGFELWIAELADGTTMSGIITAETPTSVTFRHAGGSETTIARTRITAMRIAPMSAMPEGLDAQIGVQEMADLIAFIRGGR